MYRQESSRETSVLKLSSKPFSLRAQILHENYDTYNPYLPEEDFRSSLDTSPPGSTIFTHNDPLKIIN